MQFSTKRMIKSDAISIIIPIISRERNILLERSIFFNEYTLRKEYIFFMNVSIKEMLKQFTDYENTQ